MTCNRSQGYALSFFTARFKAVRDSLVESRHTEEKRSQTLEKDMRLMTRLQLCISSFIQNLEFRFFFLRECLFYLKNIFYEKDWKTNYRFFFLWYGNDGEFWVLPESSNLGLKVTESRGIYKVMKLGFKPAGGSFDYGRSINFDKVAREVVIEAADRIDR